MESEVRFVKIEGRIQTLEEIVIEGKGGIPSLISAQTETNKKIDTLVTQLNTIIAFRRPILIGLIIIIMAAVSNEFAGPLIRHILNLPDAQLNPPALHQQSENAIQPNLPKE